MNVEIEAEAALFPEKEYINGIAVAVYTTRWCSMTRADMVDHCLYLYTKSTSNRSEKCVISKITPNK